MPELVADKPTRRQRRSAVTRTRLLDAALAAFLENGYDGTSLGEVTERADLGTGTLYLHFRDKRALYEALARRTLAEVHERWLVRAQPLAGAARVLAMVEVFLEFLIARPKLAHLFLLDGPPVESWLVGDVARVIATFLEGPQPQLRASLLIGTTLAAARHHLRNDSKPGARTLVDTAARFCEAGLAAASGPAVARPARRTR